jgi:hypothetical protein
MATWYIAALGEVASGVGVMKKLVIGSLALAMSAAVSAPVLASVIDWTLEGVTFDDGGTASGTFSTDSSTGNIVSYDITTTPGSSLVGTEYDSTTAPFVANNQSGPNSFALLTGGLYINLTFLNPLTSPGIDPIVIGNYQASNTAKSWECNNCSPIRLIATGEAVSSPVPEPSTWAMMLVGFAALGFAGYRFSRRASVAA